MVPDTITRRRLIAVGIVSAVPLVSGCSIVSSAFSNADTALGPITIENSDGTSHTIHIAVQQNSDLVFGSSYELEGVSEPESDDFGSIDSEVVDNVNWEDESGNWTIYSRVDEATSWKRHVVPTDGGCYSVRLKIEDDSSVTSFTPDCDSWPPDTE